MKGPLDENRELTEFGDKTPRLFYWEEAVDAWCPVPVDICVLDPEDLDEGEVTTIQFKRVDMTDAEFDALPEE